MKEAVDWMKKNGFECNEWVAGWYIKDDKSIKIAKKYGLKYFDSKFTYDLHDYELLGNIYSFMMIIQNIRGLFRNGI